jgi:hypothetical protein
LREIASGEEVGSEIQEICITYRGVSGRRNIRIPEKREKMHWNDTGTRQDAAEWSALPLPVSW